MQKTTAKDKVTKKFSDYLSGQGISKKSLRNYKSDISHFSAWVMLKIRSWGVYAESLTDAIPFITKSSGHEYREYLAHNNIPESTINRRLSTLRHLGSFLLTSQILDFNFTQEVSNISSQEEEKDEHPFLIKFERYLDNQEVSKNTIRNYKSDVRQFVEWLEAQKQTE